MSECGTAGHQLEHRPGVPERVVCVRPGCDLDVPQPPGVAGPMPCLHDAYRVWRVPSADAHRG